MIVCLTLGKRGALIYVKDEIIYVSAPEVDVINTVGSGDCMLASLIHSLVKNADIKEACRYAIAVSSAHVTTMNVAEVDFYHNGEFCAGAACVVGTGDIATNISSYEE